MGDSSPCFDGDEKSAWPPGFRFHPTDEELVLYYLKKKICRRRLKLDIIAEVDVYKWDPEDLPGLSKLKTGDRQWFFFSPRDRKYPNGARSNRATRHGYWKATGKDRTISCNIRSVGVKKTLVFYKGRAPSKERTDWVMHEYTMDEEELKRCPNVQDYYALYKVFKKSGPGPKNGEQYGAPFKEEEWADEDDPDVSNYSVEETPPEQLNGVISVNNSKPNGQDCQADAWDDIWKGLAEAPPVVPPRVDDYVNLLAQVIGEEEAQTPLVDSSLNGAFVADPISTVLTPTSQQYAVPENVEFTQSASSQLQLHEAPEVTSAPNISEQERGLSEEDFLEMDDLLGPEPIPQNYEKAEENLQFADDGLSILDLYHDAAMFARDIGPIDQGMVLHPYLNTIENEMVNQLNYQLQPHSVGADQISGQLWTLDQSVCTSAESIQGIIGQPTSGVVYASSSTNVPTEGNQNMNGERGNGAGNRFTSALWSFVESIPTTPASASENALVNRALVRMSSLSRMRMNALNTNAGNGGAATWKGGINKGGFIILSVIGALIAIFWVLMLGPVKMLGRCLPS